MSTLPPPRVVLERLLKHYGPQHWWVHSNRLEDWLSMILIQQTTSQNADRALVNLRPVMTVQQLLAMPTKELEELIRPAGFFHAKTKAIQALLNWYVDRGGHLAAFADRPTETLRSELLGLPGIGEETADVMLMYIFNRPLFVGDAYARRLFTRLGYGDFKTYDSLRDWLNPLAAHVPIQTAQDWHAVIDEHGKAFRREKALDEDWLRAPAPAASIKNDLS